MTMANQSKSLISKHFLLKYTDKNITIDTPMDTIIFDVIRVRFDEKEILNIAHNHKN